MFMSTWMYSVLSASCSKKWWLYSLGASSITAKYEEGQHSHIDVAQGTLKLQNLKEERRDFI